MFNVDEIRSQFPIFLQNSSLVYLDSAATCQKPKSVIEAESHFYKSQYGTVHRGVYELSMQATNLYNEARHSVARFIGAAKDEEIIFTRGTTDAINLVAQSFGKTLEKGDEVILSVMEHHSNLVPWQLLAKEKGIVLKFIPISDDAELDIAIYRSLFSSKTKLVSVAHVANSTGTINPISQIIEIAHNNGAKVLIDGAQAVCHLSVDVQELDADFYAFSGHKLYGPTGIGVLYGKYDLLEQMPPVVGGGDMIESVELKVSTYQKPPLRFEAGTPMIAQAIGLKAAIEFIQNIGLSNIANHENRLLVLATEQIQSIDGIRILGTAKEKGPIITFIHDEMHPLDIATMLDLKKIAIRSGHHCAQPTLKHFGVYSAARVSFGIYNTEQDVKAFIEGLAAVLGKVAAVT